MSESGGKRAWGILLPAPRADLTRTLRSLLWGIEAQNLLYGANQNGRKENKEIRNEHQIAREASDWIDERQNELRFINRWPESELVRRNQSKNQCRDQRCTVQLECKNITIRTWVLGIQRFCPEFLIPEVSSTKWSYAVILSRETHRKRDHNQFIRGFLVLCSTILVCPV